MLIGVSKIRKVLLFVLALAIAAVVASVMAHVAQAAYAWSE